MERIEEISVVEREGPSFEITLTDRLCVCVCVCVHVCV